MAISEQSRHDLDTKLESILGAEAATTLMEHLPPTTWADVATKRDLDLKLEVLRNETRADIHSAIGSAISGQTRTLLFAIIGSNMTMAALAFTAATVR